ncbi:tetratricopeptide repeat protein [Pedobacter mucosus]|uniref:tetratricopeptide repeat protein n=1 Tax=Pedobacter mucosus TaxID=2895286 RepID=UPI001EE4C7B4|nr:tetratricopeptide repeat protein [Pedobacter mucosus]UKT62946.1 hypothetical protein LOK61_14365 [Pedobacter mucosus]
MKTFFFLLLFLSIQTTFAQKQDIKNLYFDYLQVRMDADEQPEAITKALELLNRKTELNKTQLGNVTYHLGRLYEETGDIEKAIPYYESSIKMTPGYYVPYRALGFYNFERSNSLLKKINDAILAKNNQLIATLNKDYNILALKTIAYLEKSQACDPDDETKGMIINLYKNIKNDAAIGTLDTRLKKLSTDCITLLED